MLGFAELGLAAMLASGLLPRVTAVATLGVLAVFCGLLARALWRGNRFDCGCFGSHPVTLTYGTLGRTLFLGALAAAIVWGAFSGSPLLTGADRVLGLAAGALLVSLALVTAAVQRLGLFTESLSRFQDVARS